MIRLIWFGVLILLTLGGCGVFQSTKDEIELEAPTALTDIVSALDLSVAWSTQLGGARPSNLVNLRPQISDDKLFIASPDGVVAAIDVTDGQVIWEIDTQTRLGGGPGVGDDLVVVGSREGEVIALAMGQGEAVWRSQITSELLSIPVSVAGTVVVKAIDGRLFALSATNGARQWSYGRSIPVLTLRGSSSPVIAGGLVISGSDSGKLTALVLKTGLAVWERSIAFPDGRSELERIIDIDADPLVVGGIVYVASYQRGVMAIDLEQARTVWNQDISTVSSFSADQRHLYVTDIKDTVWALDRFSGAVVWKQEKLKFRRLTGPVVADRYIVVGDFSGILHWMSVEDGVLRGRIQIDSSGVTSVPVFSKGLVYSYSNSGELTAITLNSQ